jgi:glycosyltransferase involved in cell wall biosynthesis
MTIESPGPHRPVVILSQYMYPERNSTGELMTSLATGLAANGFAVTTYCAQPTYFRGSETVSSKLEYEGVQIRRLWATRLGRARVATRLIDAVTFAISVGIRLLKLPQGATILAVTNPPFLPVIAAVRRRLWRREFVLLVHDVYPEIAVQLRTVRQAGAVYRLWRRLDRFTLRQADTIIVLGEDMRAIVANKLDASRRGRIVVIQNWADGNRILPIPKDRSEEARRHDLVGTFVVQYSGNVGLSQGLEVLLDAAGQLRGDDVTFTIVGEGANLRQLQASAAARDIPNVRFMKRAREESLGDSLAACDVALVPLARGIEGLSVPSKYYSALASGRPILAIMNARAEVACSVLANECGLVVEPSDASGLAAAIRQLRGDPELRSRLGRNSRSAFERLYTRDRALSKYIAVLTGLHGEVQVEDLVSDKGTAP